MPDYYICPPKRPYGVGHAVVDLLMIWITCGLWFLWIIIRYLRSNIPR